MAETELAQSPNLLPLFARAGSGLLPTPGPARASDVSGDALLLSDVKTDPAALADFARVVGATLTSTLPVSYPHILAFPLQLKLLTEPTFPFPAIGMVHIYNKITQHRPIAASEALSFKVWAEPLLEHPRGRAVPVRTEARVGDELVWEETALNLRIGKRNEQAPAGPAVPSSEEYPFAAKWSLPGDLGRRYASVAGDYNPIHIHPLTARLLGFPRAIAHGFWTKSRALASLDSELPSKFTAEVAFKRPILLPAKVNLVESKLDDGIGFGVRDARKDTPHLDGRISF